MKICSKCKFGYPEPAEDYFSKKPGTKDGLQFNCKKCHTKYIKEHYSNNKKYYKDKATIRNKKVIPELLQYTINYLSTHPCVDCGEKDPLVLEFDHIKDKKECVSRKDKKECVSRLVQSGISKETLQMEIDKCEVRCCNCHRRKTVKQLGWYKNIIMPS